MKTLDCKSMSIIFYCSSISGSRRDWSRSEHMTRGSAHHATRVDMNWVSFLSFFLHIISYILGIMLCAEIMSTHIQRCHIYNTEKQTSVFSKASGLMGSFAYLEYFWAYGNIFWFSRAKCQLSLVSCVSED